MVPLAAAGPIALLQLFLKEPSEDHFQVCVADKYCKGQCKDSLLQQINENENQYLQLFFWRLDFSSDT